MTCYTRHEVAPGAHMDIPHEHDEPMAKEPGMCDAEDRNKRALYEISRQRTQDAVSINRLELILRGDGEDNACKAESRKESI